MCFGVLACEGFKLINILTNRKKYIIFDIRGLFAFFILYKMISHLIPNLGEK